MQYRLIVQVAFLWLAAVSGVAGGRTVARIDVEPLFVVPWGAAAGVAYERVPGVNLGVMSMTSVGDGRVALLASVTDEIVLAGEDGSVTERFPIPSGARDIVFDSGLLFVLFEDRVESFDLTGRSLGSEPVPGGYAGTVRIERANGVTFLLLPHGNSFPLGGFRRTEYEGAMTRTGRSFVALVDGPDSFSVRAADGDRAEFRTASGSVSGKIAGVFVIGATADRLVVEEQRFVSESPVEVERRLHIIALDDGRPVTITASIRLPDVTFALATKDLEVLPDGRVLSMVMAPSGVELFAIGTSIAAARGFPERLASARYHFNDHLVRADATSYRDPDDGSQIVPAITREQIIANAVPYTTQSWNATSANIWNATSCGGKTIQTPSWVTLGTNVGMPYCWGGWTTTGSIQGYLDLGRSAGDRNTATAFGAEPACAVGLDCSGFVSRAWGLGSKQSTSTLPGISTTKPLSQTQPGDIVNIVADHTRLIETNFGNGNYRVIESSGRDWKTSYFTYTAAQLSSYDPRVYNNVAADFPPGALTLTLTPECNGTSGRIRLNWTPSAGAGSYDIYRNGGLYASGITGTQYINSANISVGMSYTYFVRARNSAGSTDSNDASATVPNCAPNIGTSVTALADFGSVRVGGRSVARSYTVSGSGLTAAIDVQAPPGFAISFDPNTGFGTSLSIPQSGGEVPSTTVYARFVPTATGPQSGNIIHSSSGAASRTVQLGGTGTDATARPRRSDFDGDGKTDLSVFRPSNGQWWLNRSTDGTIVHSFGAPGDHLTPGDFTGDGRTDVAVWRPATGDWFVLRSEDFTYYSFPFGLNSDTPVPGDYDGDGRSDPAVFRASNATWYVQRSSGGVTALGFGLADDRPVPSDYDGDGKDDIAIFRPSNGQWWLNRSAAGVVAVTFGDSSDQCVPADYTGDGLADVALFRQSTGDWFVLRSEDFSFYSFPFGTAGDKPVPGDYDGDGRSDPGVYRPSDATWYLNRSTEGILIAPFGAPTDLPVPNAPVK